MKTTCQTNGIVVKGYGRGSKELGIPTGKICLFVPPPKYLYFFLANLNEEAVECLSYLKTGIYYGWAQLIVPPGQPSTNNGIYPMVMSLGWNPFYKNEKKSAVIQSFLWIFTVCGVFRKFIFFINLTAIFMEQL